ncbi:MAG: YchJ family metal-binding protein [Desulfurivibrionaceae bacterium]|nr:YchJ family metal-binding protein [Desulfurivibrionaceae bacterium]
MTVCPCNPQSKFDECCGPYLAGDQLPPTAEALMRSRYSAYVLEDYPYVLKTCHESTRPAKEEFDEGCAVKWCGLEIRATEAGGADDDEGKVEFVASYRAGDAILGLHEKAEFVKEEGRWFYVDGEIVKPGQASSDKIGRNEPCPCGSGKKFKKCCR